MTIGRKLTLGFAGLAALTGLMGVTSLNAIGRLKESFDLTAEVTARRIVLANRINTAVADMLAWQRALLLHNGEKNLAGVSEARTRFAAAAETAGKAVDELRAVDDAEARGLAEEMHAGLAAWAAGMAEIERLCAAGDAAGALKYGTERILPVYEAIHRNGGRLETMAQQELEADKAAAAAQHARSRWLNLVLMGISLGLGGLVLFMVRGIGRGVGRLAGELSEGAEQVASAAAQVSSASQQLAQGASEQAASLEETSATSVEINSMTCKNTENAGAAADLMANAAQLIEDANRRLDQMVASMRDINESSGKISKIIKVIDEIAFQTNILALNAAVEAARAGEAGMGFAVVADEVRNLAQRCAQAAKDTAGLIEESIAKSNEGRSRLDEVAASIRSITDSAAKVKTLIDEINLGSQEQSRGMEQVARAIAQMEQVTRKTAASAEESASAGEELSAQGGTLRGIVSRLSAMVGEAGENAVRATDPVGHAANLAALGEAVGYRRAGAPAPALAAETWNMEDGCRES